MKRIIKGEFLVTTSDSYYGIKKDLRISLVNIKNSL